MKDITVLTTACAAMFMPGFFRCLKENGERRIKIIGVDMGMVILNTLVSTPAPSILAAS